MKITASLLTRLCLPWLAAFAFAAAPAGHAEPPTQKIDVSKLKYEPGDVVIPNPTEGFSTVDKLGTISDDRIGHLCAEIETSKGRIEVELDFQGAPLAVMNFVGLAEGMLPAWNRPLARPFYDGTTFHRVVKGFVVQGGDPLSADPATPAEKLGEGGPDWSFPDEFNPALRHDMAGMISMANDGPDTNGSQFFITLAETNRLNYLHSVFGQVVRGMEVVNRIEQGDRILHVTIKRTGPAAEAFRADAKAFAALEANVVVKRRAAAPAGFIYLIDETKTLPDFRVKNFNYKLANYERATGHRIVVRLLSDFVADAPGQSRGNAVKKIAGELGLPDTGDNVLACCFVAQHGWTTRLGEATYPALIGEAGSTEELMANGTLHDRKTALVARADALAQEGKLKESVDALIDTLILTMDDHTLQQQKPPDSAHRKPKPSNQSHEQTTQVRGNRFQTTRSIAGNSQDPFRKKHEPPQKHRVGRCAGEIGSRSCQIAFPS